MAYRAPLTNFSRGEIAPELYGRFDVSTYAAALKRARNVVVLKTGAITMRPGTRYVGEVYDSAQPTRLLPFQFSTEQAYALEFGQGIMRPVALGGQVLEGELAITGATNANPVVLAVAYHGYVPGDDIYINNVQGMTELNGRIFRVLSVPDVNHLAIGIDGSGFGVFTGSTGGGTNAAPPPPPPADPPVTPPVAPPAPPSTGGSGGNPNGGGGGFGVGYVVV